MLSEVASGSTNDPEPMGFEISTETATTDGDGLASSQIGNWEVYWEV